jgi:methionine aminotransferase
MAITLASRHSAADTTIFSVMSALAQECNAINLSQGFPDFAIDEALMQQLFQAAQQGFNQYAPMTGLPVLRQAIAARHSREYGIAVDAEQEITITPGATYAIYTACTAVLQPGDEVIILEPAYDSYRPNIEMNGGVVVPVKLKYPDFRPDWQAISDAITTRTRAIIVNTPHNPSGSIWQQSDWDQLATLLRDTEVVVISDEVYEQLVFDGQQHYSVLQHPELRERSFAVYSFGKVYNNTGWKVGYCIAPPAFSKAFRKVHQFLSFSVNTPAQQALAAFMIQPASIPVNTAMQARRDHFLRAMQATPFHLLPPAAGGFFQLASYEGLSDMPEADFARWLTRTHGVATIPVSAFYSDQQDNKLLRFCFAKKESTLTEAAQKLAQLTV